MKLKLVILSVLLMVIPSVAAQDSGVQEFYGSINRDQSYAFFHLDDIKAGQTIYVYAESDEIDTWIAVCDEACEDLLAENDDLSQEDANSALEYEFPEDGIYHLLVSDCCDEEAEGDFWLLVSLDNPEVLTGDAEPTGAEIFFLEEGIDNSSCVLNGRDVQAVLDALEISGEDLEDILEANEWDSVEAVQELVDAGDVSWGRFVNYMEEESGKTLPVCNVECLPIEHDVQAVFDAFGFSGEVLENILEDNEWDSVEAVQELEDNGDLIWDKFITYLERESGMSLPMCGS